MSHFKLKPDKVRHIIEIKTLDETHRKIVKNFQKKKDTLPNKKKKLESLKKKLERIENKDKSTYTNQDIRDKSSLRTEINEIEEEINDIENNVMELDYYSKTDDLLMDYYEIFEHEDNKLYEANPELSKAKTTESKNNYEMLDRLNNMKKKTRKVKKVTKRRKRRVEAENSRAITSYFNVEILDEEKEKTNNSRAELYEQYRTVTDSEYHTEKQRNNRELKRCPLCDKEKTLNQTDGIYVCETCGVFEMVIIESEKPNYKDSSIPEKPGYPYKRINHFNESVLRVLNIEIKMF